MAREKGMRVTKVAIQPPTSMPLWAPFCLGTSGIPIKHSTAPTTRMGTEM